MRIAIISRWTLSLIGVAILGALVWIFGPFLAALAGPLPRAALIALLLLVWGGLNWAIGYRRRRQEAALAKGIAAPDPSDIASAEESAVPSPCCARRGARAAISMSSLGMSSSGRRVRARRPRS
jgi:type VI protein secretion system component VasK